MRLLEQSPNMLALAAAAATGLTCLTGCDPEKSGQSTGTHSSQPPAAEQNSNNNPSQPIGQFLPEPAFNREAAGGPNLANGRMDTVKCRGVVAKIVNGVVSIDVEASPVPEDPWIGLVFNSSTGVQKGHTKGLHAQVDNPGVGSNARVTATVEFPVGGKKVIGRANCNIISVAQ